MLSLNSRVLLAASAVLASFFGLAGVTLDRVYTQSAKTALKDRLQGEVHALIASAALDSKGRIYIPESYEDERFMMVLPELYAQITANGDELIWRSPSLNDIGLHFPMGLQRNESVFKEEALPNGESYATYSLGVAWDDTPEMYIYTFSSAENLMETHKQIAHFRRNLWGWLGGVALILLAVQGTILRWGLAPLQIAANELTAIEAGKQQRLQYSYPGEMKGLTNNVNALLDHQQEHLERYRHTLGDLAHSLKTPLAVLQSTVDEEKSNAKIVQIVQEQVNRMNQITEYQLQRAATAGQLPLRAPVSVQTIIEKVMKSLSKVYAEKQVLTHTDVKADVVFHGDESDLMEIIGNLADNAFKWCNGKVSISALLRRDTKDKSATIVIQVDDDGPGIPGPMINQVVQRGVRADQGISGHGIGLSVVQDIVQIYGGRLGISHSRYGGASITVSLPEVA
jgi:two-component system sensor histidine kinase PhoQ